MASRSIDGPEKDWLDWRDMTRLTRLSENSLRRLMAEGTFPPQRQLTPGVRMWHWTDYLYWTLRVGIFGRTLPDSDPPQTATDLHRPPASAN